MQIIMTIRIQQGEKRESRNYKKQVEIIKKVTDQIQLKKNYKLKNNMVEITGSKSKSQDI